MAKKKSESLRREAAEHRDDTATQELPGAANVESLPSWSFWARLFASLALALHVMAVFVPPFRFLTMGLGSREGSPATAAVAAAFRPYCDAMFLNHGYAFFAPDPGPSHLMRVHVEMPNSQPSFDVTYPDREKQWPRLLYHRHFMLSEHLNTRYAPPSIPPEADAATKAAWKEARETYDQLWQSYERHLTKKFGAASVSITRVEHRQPVPDEFSTGTMPLKDPRLYQDLPDRPTAGGQP